MCRAKTRDRGGAALSEMAPALVILLVVFLIPFLALGSLAIRFLACQGVVDQMAHKLAIAEKRSDAYSILANDSRWREFLGKLGVHVSGAQLRLVVCAQDANEKLVLAGSTPVPADWLPGGPRGTCTYSVDFSADCSLLPFLGSSIIAVPGLTSPADFKFRGVSQWENLGKNPSTLEYFINE